MTKFKYQFEQNLRAANAISRKKCYHLHFFEVKLVLIGI